MVSSMDDVLPYYSELPRLSEEAIRLISGVSSFASPVVDLRPFIVLQGDYGPATIRAAQVWSVPVETVVVCGHAPQPSVLRCEAGHTWRSGCEERPAWSVDPSHHSECKRTLSREP